MERARVCSLKTCDDINSVYKLQMLAARVILNADWKERSADNLFKQLKWLLLIKDEITVQKCCLVFRRIIGDSPNYMTQLEI